MSRKTAELLTKGGKKACEQGKQKGSPSGPKKKKKEFWNSKVYGFPYV